MRLPNAHPRYASTDDGSLEPKLPQTNASKTVFISPAVLEQINSENFLPASLFEDITSTEEAMSTPQNKGQGQVVVAGVVPSRVHHPLPSLAIQITSMSAATTITS